MDSTHQRSDSGCPQLLADVAVWRRFFSKVDVGDCWEWTGARNSGGYGQFWWEGRMPTAHRWLYEQLVAKVPDGLQLDHLCRNRRCVNPDHLEPVTCRVNVHRGIAPAARNAGKTTCRAGHPLDAANTYEYPDGARRCRTCQREADARYKENQRGKPAPVGSCAVPA